MFTKKLLTALSLYLVPFAVLSEGREPTPTVNIVPEPSTMALLGVGVAAALYVARRKRR